MSKTTVPDKMTLRVALLKEELTKYLQRESTMDEILDWINGDEDERIRILGLR